MVWKITPDELLVRYADGERNFAGIELIQSAEEPKDNMIDLQGAILPDINLRGAYLRQADLTGAEIDRAYMKEVIFCNTIMPDGSIRTDSL